MPDIAKCKGEESYDNWLAIICPFRSSCWRCTSPDSEFRQAYFAKLPLFTEGGASTCEQYWDVDLRHAAGRKS